MSAPASSASASSPSKLHQCPHTCGCVRYRSKIVEGRLLFKNMANHLRGRKAHPECCITCPAYANHLESRHMECHEDSADLDDASWGVPDSEIARAMGCSSPHKRRAEEEGVPPPLLPLDRVASQRAVSVPVLAPMQAPMQAPSPKKARLTPEPVAAAAAASALPYLPAAEFQVAAAPPSQYMTSSQYQAAILAKVDEQVAVLRVRFGEAQKEAIKEMRERQINVDCEGVSKTAIDRFGEEIKRAGFDGLRQVDDRTIAVDV